MYTLKMSLSLLYNFVLLLGFAICFVSSVFGTVILTSPNGPHHLYFILSTSYVCFCITAIVAASLQRIQSSGLHRVFSSDVRSSVIMSEFEKVSDRAVFLLSQMSHLVALHEGIVLFRKYVASEKEGMHNISSAMVGLQRGRILEDGYRQLSKISNNLLKGTIRVKFANLQGLDEAGIDQDNVFKEFLELIVKEVFNPDLSLFKFQSSEINSTWRSFVSAQKSTPPTQAGHSGKNLDTTY